jgi:hypothetical protein
MATTTTNFGWDIPQSTDLVKDGATAIAALGQDIDTAMVDLKGGTTGQVLAKASGTDLDFSWVAVDPLIILDAKGDLITATAADTPARLAVGTNGQVLTADSTAATGLAWATAASGAFTFAAWTPTYTNITVGNGTVTARYGQSGKFVFAYYKLVFGSTTSITATQPRITLPVTAANTNAIGSAYVLDAATNEYICQAKQDTTTNVAILSPQSGSNAASSISSTFPITFTTNDEIRFVLVYEAA